MLNTFMIMRINLMCISRKKVIFVLVVAVLTIAILLLIPTRKVVYKKLFPQRLCWLKVENESVLPAINCPSQAIVTCPQGGRLGNQIWETASVWAIFKKTGLNPYIPCCMKKELEKLFRLINMPCLEEIAHCPVGNHHTLVDTWEKWNGSLQENIILKPTTFLDELVVPLLEEFRKEFVVKEKLLTNSQIILKSLMKRCAGCLYVGVHIRRADYIR